MKEIHEIFSNEQLVKFIPSNLRHNDFTGILWAAGSTFANGEFMLIDDEINVNEKGLKRFRKIWKAPLSKINYPQQ